MSVGLITKNKQFSCKSWTSKNRKPHSSLVSHNEYRNPPSPEDLHTFPYVVFASQFLCMPLMGNLEAALFSPTHTLRTRASGLFHEYYTHNKSLFMNYENIVQYSLERGGGGEKQKSMRVSLKKIFIHLQDKRNSYMSNCIQVHKSSSVTHTKHFPVFSESCRSIKSTVLLLKQ